MPPGRSISRQSRSSSRVVLVALSIEIPLRNSCAGLNGTNAPFNCPINTHLAPRASERRVGVNIGVPTVSSTQSTPSPPVSAFTSAEKSPSRDVTTTASAPFPLSISAFAADVVCAITQPPARFASCTPCTPRPPPAPVTITRSPGAMRPTVRTACSIVPMAQDAMAAASSATSSGTDTTLSASTTTSSAYPPFSRVSPRNTCSAHSGSRPLRQ